MEPLVGLEPTTFRLQSDCSTIELKWPIFQKRLHLTDECSFVQEQKAQIVSL